MRSPFLVERSETVFLLMSVCDVSEETKMKGRCFYLGACTQGKTDAFHLVRTASPTHTDVRVF